jgi:hypothetical protein
MGASNSTRKNFKFYNMKAKADETNKPHFALSEKNEGTGKWATTGEFDTISGAILSADIEEKEYEGAKIKNFILIMEDEDETMKVSMTHNQVTYNIINSLASDPAKLVTYELRLYKKPDKNGKMWGAAAVTCGIDTKCAWAVDPKSAPQGEKVMKPDGSPFMLAGKQVYDHSKTQKFWEDLFTDKIIGTFGKPAARPAATTGAPASSAPATTSQEAGEDIDPLPF